MKTLICAFFVLATIAAAQAETVTLKNGKVLEDAVITEKNDEYIMLLYRGVPLKYYLTEIASFGDSQSTSTSARADESKNTEALFPGDPVSTRRIAINPPVELDFKTKKEIYELRKLYVAQHPELVDTEYTPSEAVFGPIEDKKPWWGILGSSYYGSGDQSIVGASEESRFLANPFLYAALSDVYAYRVKNSNLAAIEIYPKPISLLWDKVHGVAKVTYDVTNCWQKKKAYYSPTEYEHGFELVAYNARDFGYSYLYFMRGKSRNIILSPASTNVLTIKQFIHCGGSCGYQGGCNNMSPEQPELFFKVSNVPAQLYIKLWKEQPSDNNQPPDMIFIIEMI